MNVSFHRPEYSFGGCGWSYRRQGGRRGECRRGQALSGRSGISYVRRCSGRAAASGGQLADVVEEDGALEGVELRGVSRDLGEEGVGHENGRLVAVAGGGVAQQGGDVDLQSLGEAIERGQRGHGLAVLDLRDVGAGHVHAGGQLTLREVADVAQIAHGCRYLDAFARCGCLGYESQGCRSRFWLFDLEAFVAAAAQGVRCAELHQAAVVAT